MKSDQTQAYVKRDMILKLLSDDEIAKVSTAETATILDDGDEYLDLEQLDKGVTRAGAGKAPIMGHVLPRKAVQEGTWAKILVQMGKA